MEQVGKYELYSLDDALDMHFGKVGTPERNAHEERVASAVQAYKLGKSIKKARVEQHLK